MTAFRKILIANRGEIALRIGRSARALGCRTVAVYSEADAGAPHVHAADQAVPIGPPSAAESYLNIERIVAAAKRAGADAVHPGYGFLAENADFAAACADAGIVFIGPDAEAIRLMGDKAAAKRRMREAGVPCVPGYDGDDQSDERLVREADAVGFPLMVKAAAGGGGRGLRVVDSADGLAKAIASARSEALNAFGSDTLILEKALAEPRHVEIQVLADRRGNVVHLGERDCSVQRRHQKVIEETPSPAVTPDLRERMGRDAVAAARAIDYVGAGTVEFLLDEEGRFHFLEMNTRLQVEHPVTEMVTGLDLVAWQIRIAAGEPLSFSQDTIGLRGHAIEARLYAEDPSAGFLPQSGRVLAWRPPAGEGVRTDHGLAAGQDIGSHYDPLIAKIAAFGETREVARRRLIAALEDTVLLGPPSNRSFLVAALEHEAFAAGRATTGFIDRHFPPSALTRPAADDRVKGLSAALIYERSDGDRRDLLANWRSTGPAAWPLRLDFGEGPAEVVVACAGEAVYDVSVDGAEVRVEIQEKGDGRVRFLCDGLVETAHYAFSDEGLHLSLGRLSATVSEIEFGAGAAKGAAGDGRLVAPMSGRIIAVLARPGDAVRRGQALAVLEAMKMEHDIVADIDGTVDRVAVTEGEQVAARQLVLALAPIGGT